MREIEKGQKQLKEEFMIREQQRKEQYKERSKELTERADEQLL